MNAHLGLMIAMIMQIVQTVMEGLIVHAKETISGMENYVSVSAIYFLNKFGRIKHYNCNCRYQRMQRNL